MEQFVGVHRFIQQPLMIVLGLPTRAGAAKSGHGAWAARGVVTFVSMYVGAIVTFMATRSLAAWVASMRRREIPARPTRQP